VATKVISLPAPPTQGIHFLTQLHLAAVQLQSGQIVVIDMTNGTFMTILAAPLVQRQIYVQPFSGLLNVPGPNLDVTVDLNPLRQNPVGPPTVHSEALLASSNEAVNFVPPPPVGGALVTQMVHQVGDVYDPQLHHFSVAPGGGTPGANYQVDCGSTRNSASQMDPVSGTFEDDGSTEFAVLANPGESVCLRVYDPEGNASPEVCLIAAAGVGVGEHAIPSHFSLALASANPVRDKAQFHFALPTRGRVDLAIYDMTGRRVASLVAQDRDPGEYDEAWDLTTSSGALAPAGVYFAKFRVGSFEQSKRLIVVR
jgi:hypothetical protein